MTDILFERTMTGGAVARIRRVTASLLPFADEDSAVARLVAQRGAR